MRSGINDNGGGLTLALNAAEGLLQIALGRALPTGETELVCGQQWLARTQGVEMLAPALQNIFALLKLSPQAVERVAAVNGPGGFTGLRLALSTTAALSRGLGIPQAGIGYLPLLAANAACGLTETNAETALCVFTHARNNLVYGQIFSRKNAAETAMAGTTALLRPLSGLKVLELEQCPAFIEEAVQPLGANPEITLLGSGASRNYATLSVLLLQSGLRARLAGEAYNAPAPALLLEAALSLPESAYGGTDIAPLYARDSDAEEDLERIAVKLGHEPAESRARLNALLGREPSGGGL